MIRSSETEIAKDMVSIYQQNAKAEEKLKVGLWIENTSEKEIMVNDMERGLVWFIQPMNYFM